MSRVSRALREAPETVGQVPEGWVEEGIAGLVSVVIPTRDRARLLAEAIDSVLAQTYRPLEIVVVDDGSRDDTRAVVEGYGEIARYLRHERSRGPSAARNTGILRARGELIAFLDSDDLWEPDKLERQLRLLREDPAVGMVGGGCRYVDPAGRVIGAPQPGPPGISFEEFAIFTALPGSASNAVIRRRVLADAGLFDESLHRAEDRDLWMRVSARAPVRCVPDPTVRIRVHGERRPNEGLDLVRASRRRVNARIADRSLRRRADAWLWFHLFRLAADGGRWGSAVWFLARSAWSHPGRVSPRTARLRPAVERLLPPSLRALVAGAVRRFRAVPPGSSARPEGRPGPGGG